MKHLPKLPHLPRRRRAVRIIKNLDLYEVSMVSPAYAQFNVAMTNAAQNATVSMNRLAQAFGVAVPNAQPGDTVTITVNPTFSKE